MSEAKLTAGELDAFLNLTCDEPSAYVKAASVLEYFDPMTIRPAPSDSQGIERSKVLDELLPKSEAFAATGGGKSWALLLHERREALRLLGSKKAMLSALKPNLPIVPNTPIQRMLNRLLSNPGPISLDGLARDELAALITVIGWLDGIVSNLPDVSMVRRALAREDLLAPMKRLTFQGFVNREREIDQLSNYVFSRPSPSPLFIYGTGGVGKSTLLAHFILAKLVPAGVGLAYVDLDRPTIRPQQPVTIVLELVRQLQGQLDLPASEVDAFAKQVSFAVGRQDVSRHLESVSVGFGDIQDVLHELERRLQKWLGGRTGVLIVDTIEEAQYLGADIMEPLVEFLLRLCYTSEIRMILSGRGLPDEFVAQAFQEYAGQSQSAADNEEDKRRRLEGVPLPYRPINLTELDPDPARVLLRHAVVSEGARELTVDEEDEVIAIVTRNPMCLRLAARVVRDEGAEKLRSSRSEFMAKLKAEKIQALLYSRILLNVHSENVRKVAYPGLVVRRVTPAVIKQVLAEPCELNLEGEDAETAAFLELRRESALMDPDPNDHYVIYHRPDVRRTMLLDLTDHVDATVVKAIHDKAIEYYELNPSPAGRAEEIYHRLCRGDQPAALDSRWISEAAPFLRNVEDLPAQQRLWLADKLGVTLDETVRNIASQATWEQQVAISVNRFLLSGSPTRALELLRERKARLPRSPLFNLEAEALRFMSDFDGAIEVARRGVESAGQAGATDMALELLLKMALVEEGRAQLQESLSLISEAAGVATHSTNAILQFSVKIASLRLQRKLRPQGIEERGSLIEDAIRFLTPDLLRKLRNFPVILKEAGAELARYDSRIASLTISVRGLEVEGDNQAQALGKALAGLRESLGADTGSRITSGVARFERTNFDPSVVRNWAKEVLTDHDVRVVSSALKHDKATQEKVAEHLEASEAGNLEGIVMPAGRPAVLIRRDSYDDLSGRWASLNRPEVRSRIQAVLVSIGRIELPQNSLIPYGGTGFMVGTELIATARHVAQLFAQGAGLNVRYLPGGAAVNFGREVDTPASDQSRFHLITGVEMIHPYWDFALLRVQGVAGAPLRLSTVPPETLDGSEVVVVGYPARDSRTDLAVQDRTFAGIYEVKRMLPGVIRNREKVRSFENVVTTLTHDASTAGGCGGAPVIQVTTGEVVGVQFASQYLKGSYAVPAYELARDRRVAALLNFIGPLPAPTDEWEHAWSAVGGSANDGTRV